MQNVGYKFKAASLLSKMLNFLPKLRPATVATSLFLYTYRHICVGILAKSVLSHASSSFSI